MSPGRPFNMSPKFSDKRHVYGWRCSPWQPLREFVEVQVFSAWIPILNSGFTMENQRFYVFLWPCSFLLSWWPFHFSGLDGQEPLGLTLKHSSLTPAVDDPVKKPFGIIYHRVSWLTRSVLGHISYIVIYNICTVTIWYSMVHVSDTCCNSTYTIVSRIASLQIPSGKLTVCYEKSPFIRGKLIINGPSSIAMLVLTRG